MAGASDALEDAKNGVEVVIEEEIDLSINNLFNSVAFHNIKDVLINILQPVSVLALGCVCMGLMVTRSQKATESLLIWGKGIVISFVIISCFNLITTAVATMVATHAYGFK